jgi:hypothetical protein
MGKRAKMECVAKLAVCTKLLKSHGLEKRHNPHGTEKERWEVPILSWNLIV